MVYLQSYIFIYHPLLSVTTVAQGQPRSQTE